MARSIEAVADAAGETAARVGRWRELGLVGGSDDGLPPDTIERIRLIQYAERRGLSADDIVEACSTQGDVLGEFVELITDGAPRTAHTVEAVAGQTGLEPNAMRRLWVASGLGDQDEAFDEDLEAQRWMSLALAAGIPEDALLQLIRVYADAIGRVAEAENRLFHFYVHERLRAEGLVEIGAERLRLTPRGILFADEVGVRFL